MLAASCYFLGKTLHVQAMVLCVEWGQLMSPPTLKIMAICESYIPSLDGSWLLLTVIGMGLYDVSCEC